jgi:dTDP-4-dehydrorhamnose 3,5-epimerase
MDLEPTHLHCGAILYPTRVIPHSKGDILHGLKASDAGFIDFGEAYFSHILPGEMKRWRKHQEMTMNILVPVGKIKFHLQRDEQDAVEVIALGEENYQRLCIPPGVWMAFEGIGQATNLLMNLASLEHDPAESITRDF